MAALPTHPAHTAQPMSLCACMRGCASVARACVLLCVCYCVFLHAQSPHTEAALSEHECVWVHACVLTRWMGLQKRLQQTPGIVSISRGRCMSVICALWNLHPCVRACGHCGAVQCGAVRCSDAVRCGAVRCSDAVRCGAVQ